MRNSWKHQLKNMYQAPAPERKKAFLRELDYPKAAGFEFIRTQAGYIRKRVWAATGVLLLLAMCCGKYAVFIGLKYSMIWSISAVMPVLAVILMLETFQSEFYGMSELEMSTRHNLPQVLLARMGIMAFGNLLFLAAAAVPAASVHDGIGYVRTGIYLLVPYLATCVLTLMIQCWKKGRETIWYSILAGGFTIAAECIWVNLDVQMYDDRRFFIWAAVFLLLIACMAGQIRNVRKNREEYIDGTCI